jgi:hypothetical protein
MENVFEKFNKMFDVPGLLDDVEKASSNKGDFDEVPHGNYEVKVVKIELGETGPQSTTPGMPMVKIWYEVVAGDYKGQKIFQNQMINKGFGIHMMNQLLTSFESGIPIQFENFVQYADLLGKVFDAIDGKAEYQLSYQVNPKNEKFSTYEIVQKF